jgi:hypothetical protein
LCNSGLEFHIHSRRSNPVARSVAVCGTALQSLISARRRVPDTNPMGFLVTTNLTTRLTQLAATFLAEWPQRGLMGAEELGKSTAVEPAVRRAERCVLRMRVEAGENYLDLFQVQAGLDVKALMCNQLRAMAKVQSHAVWLTLPRRYPGPGGWRLPHPASHSLITYLFRGDCRREFRISQVSVHVFVDGGISQRYRG